MNKKDGGPAFPRTIEALDAGCNARPLDGYGGMFLRDWFAGQALQGMLAVEPSDCVATELARCAYEMADAMLKERDE